MLYRKMSLFRIDFFRWMVAISVFAVVAVPLYIVFSLVPSMNKLLLASVETDAIHVAKHLTYILFPSEKPLIKDNISPSFPQQIKKVQAEFSLSGVNIYSPSGELVFSTDSEAVGTTTNFHSQKNGASNGKVSSKIVQMSLRDHKGEIKPFDVVEVYVPVVRQNDLVGAFQIYYDTSSPLENYRLFVKKIYGILVIIVVGLLAVLASVTAWARRSLAAKARAEEKVSKQSMDLQKMNMELAGLYEISREKQNEVLAAQEEKFKALDKMQKEMERSREIKLELLRHIVKTQEDERARIARELHDETAQILTAASLNMEALKKYISDIPEAEELVSRAKNLCRQMSQGLYRLVHDLRPAQLDDLGLVPALQHLTEEGSCCGGMQAKLKISGKQRRLDPFVETVLYRAAQEALTNAARHSQVEETFIHLSFGPEQVILRVRDHGVGFDPEKLEPTSKSGWGLAGIRERVESVKGHFYVQSSPGNGTLIEIIVPIVKKTHHDQAVVNEAGIL